MIDTKVNAIKMAPTFLFSVKYFLDLAALKLSF